MIKKIFTFSAILIHMQVQAQKMDKRQVQQQKADSIKLSYLSALAEKYPLLRQGVIRTEIVANSHVKTNLYGKRIFEGNGGLQRIQASFNVPLKQWKKNHLTANLSYLGQHLVIDDVISNSSNEELQDVKYTRSTIGLTANFSRADTLFGRLFQFSGSINGLTNNLNAIRTVTYMGTVLTTINRTSSSSLTLGLLVVANPASNFPVFPIVSYWRRLGWQGSELFADLPSRIVVRQSLSAKSWVTFGSELGSAVSFFEFNQPSVPYNASNAILDLKTGLGFEYRVAHKVIFGVNGGLYSSLYNRLAETNHDINDYFININKGSSAYVNFSVSFLPFWGFRSK